MLNPTRLSAQQGNAASLADGRSQQLSGNKTRSRPKAIHRHRSVSTGSTHTAQSGSEGGKQREEDAKKRFDLSMTSPLFKYKFWSSNSTVIYDYQFVSVCLPVSHACTSRARTTNFALFEPWSPSAMANHRWFWFHWILSLSLSLSLTML